MSLDSSLTKSSSSKCSLISPALFLQEFHIDLLDTWGKDVHGCALLQHNLQQQNAENKINEHHHMLVKLWAINTAELWSHVKERWHPYVLRYLGECCRLLGENKQTKSTEQKVQFGLTYIKSKGFQCVGCGSMYKVFGTCSCF